jgi:hypothetical protein
VVGIRTKPEKVNTDGQTFGRESGGHGKSGEGYQWRHCGTAIEPGIDHGKPIRTRHIDSRN